MDYRVAVLGRRKFRTRIKNLEDYVAELEEQIEILENRISTLEGQVADLEAQNYTLTQQLQAAQELAELRRMIIYVKEQYIGTLQGILDANGISYPPEPTYP